MSYTKTKTIKQKIMKQKWHCYRFEQTDQTHQFTSSLQSFNSSLQCMNPVDRKRL